MNTGDAERWRSIDALFDDLIDLAPADRAAYLDAHCPDAAMRQEVERLLAASSDARTFLETRPAVPAALAALGPEALGTDVLGLDVIGPAAPPAAPDLAGRQVGAYRLLREIGRGGMGAVYLAERADGQFAQRVAVKRLHAGFDTAAVHERFGQERQILARLEHPHITRLIDGGVDAEGCPYLVMEYVEGVPITDYCDARRLSVDERLALFATVCRAVHFAHQNLVVHRDLKPSNILVTEDGTVKLLDFGIAKLINPASAGLLDTEGAGASPVVVTQTGIRLLTPGYASPEQVRGDAVTTASDVYSLGVVLYELLTGRLPYRLPSRLLHEVERIICETEPEKPSTAVTRLEGVRAEGKVVSAAGLVRGTTVERLRRQLAGDLDNVVLMALRKEPERRYASAEALMEDLRRYLGHLPVEARPSTAGYRVAKFVRRHRLGVAAAALVVLLVAGLSGAFTWRLAAERDRSRLEAQKAEHVSAFLLDLFDASDPFAVEAARGDTLTARTLLARGAARVQTHLADEPEVQVDMLHKIAKVYQQLGMTDEALAMLREALPRARAVLGPTAPEVASMLSDLGTLLERRERYDEAEQAAREAVALWRAALGERHTDYATGLNNLAMILVARRQYPEADSLLRRAVAIHQAAGDTLEAVEAMANLSIALNHQGYYDAADSVGRAGLALRRRLYGDDHPSIAVGLHTLVQVARLRGDNAEAEALARELLARLEPIVGERHPLVQTTLNNLAMTLVNQRKYAEGEQVYRRAIALEVEQNGEESLGATLVMGNLGELYRASGRFDEAEALYRRAVALRERVLDARHPDLAVMRHGLGNVLRDRQRYAEAAALYRQAIDVYAEKMPPQHPHTAVFRGNLAFCLFHLGRLGEAEALLLRAYEDLRASVGEAHPFTVTTRRRLARVYETLGRPDEAARYRPPADSTASTALPR